MREGWSLRGRLLTALVALATLLFGVGATQDYLAHRSASNRLFDDSMRESAGLVLQLAQHEMAEHGQMLGIELLRAETSPGPYDFRFQVWTPDMQAGYQSSGGIAAPFMDFESDGFAAIEIDGEPWRAYSLWNPARTLQVQIAQRQQVRIAEERAALLWLAGSLVLMLAVAVALIWWIVGASMRPLQQIAAGVASRSEQDLSRVDVEAAPREVRPLLTALNRLLERMAAALASERRFTSDAAHELRTPLAAIRANAQALLGARDAAEHERTARDLLASVDRGTRLVDQLLALARADQSGASAQLQAVDLAGIAGEQALQHRATARRLGVTLHESLAPAPLHGDPALLAAMTRNLLDNALRYGKPGGNVRIATSCRSGEVELVVEDDGPGIAPAERQKVFERFHRLPDARASGTGLGLSIVQRIVELHRGRILIEEGTGGRGTRVRACFAARESGSGENFPGEAAEGGAAIAPDLEPDLRRQA